MMKRKLFTGITTLAIFTTMILPASAATSADKIAIEGKKTVTVGKTIELDSEIYPDKVEVKDSDIIWTSSKPSVAKILRKYDDDTQLKGVKAGTTTITVRIKGPDIKATQKVTVKKATSTTSSTSTDKTKLTKYKKKAKNIKTEIKKVTLASTFEGRRTQYNDFEKRLDSIGNKLDSMEDKWEDKYDSGEISRTTYRSMEKEIEKVEDYLETVENYLEKKFNYEFDD